MKSSQGGLAALAAAILCPLLGAGQTGPEALQQRGIARLERLIDAFRRSGMQASQPGELEGAASDLAVSYRGFATASNFAQAAWSLVRLADCERLQTLLVQSIPTNPQAAGQRSQALAANALDHYKQGAALARKTRMNFYLVKALSGLALVYGTQYHDYGSANTGILEALRAAASCPDARGCYEEALESKVTLESARGELFSAASHVNGWLALLQGSSNAPALYRAYTDRSSIYRSMADGCSDSYQKSVQVCYRLIDLAEADSVKARDIAVQAGYSYFASLAEKEMWQLESLRSLTRTMGDHSKVPKGTFAPKSPKDVLATGILPPTAYSSSQIEELKSEIAALMMSLAPGPLLAAGPVTTWVQAEMEYVQGRTDAALEGYLRAIQAVEEEREKVSEDAARSSFLDDKASLYERPILLLLWKNRTSEAFDLLERTRARVTAELVSANSLRLSKPVDRTRFAALARKRAEIASLETCFVNLVVSPEVNCLKDAGAVGTAQTHLAELEAEYDQLLLGGAREAPRAQNTIVSRPASLAEVQNSLRQDPADLLYYYVRDSALILIHVGADSVDVRNVFLPHFELAEKVGELTRSMSKQGTAFRDDVAKELFLYLIQPARQWLRTDRLIVIPQDELESLPFQALQDPADGSFAGERFAISYAPSASILMQLRKQRNLAGASVLAAADANALPGAQKEVEALRLYSGRTKIVADPLIRKADFLQWAGSYDIVHLAVHGAFDGQEPLLSRVELGGEGEEGYLTAAEMFGLPLEKTRLVTLSACETGRVRTTHANEVQGIQQALLFAGAQSLLVSAWKVDSEPTSIWMQAFYRAARTRPPAEAAREAIRGMRRNPQYAHPHYWAPFLLIAR